MTIYIDIHLPEAVLRRAFDRAADVIIDGFEQRLRRRGLPDAEVEALVYAAMVEATRCRNALTSSAA